LSDERNDYAKRLAVANAYKQANGNAAVLPPDDVFDTLCRKRSLPVDELRKIHEAHDHKKVNIVLSQQRKSKRATGYVGLTLLHDKTGVRVMFEDKWHGTFRKAIEAAEKYNNLAKAKYGERAVLNDNMAALDRLQAIVDEHRAAKESKAKTVERCKKVMNQAIMNQATSQSIAGRGR
jgi:hypothetical protein